MTSSKLKLNDNGVIITQKIAQLLKLHKGDDLQIQDANNNKYTLTISGVAQNYTVDYIYMNQAVYQKVFGNELSYNVIVSNHSANESTMAKHLIDSGFVLNVVYTKDVMRKANESSESLNSIIILLVVVASLLEILVLYNLTAINISERTREIATLKVLGFTDGETNGYIYREAIILTIISIGIGLLTGAYQIGKRYFPETSAYNIS